MLWVMSCYLMFASFGQTFWVPEPVSEKIPNVGSLNMSEFSCRFQGNYGVIHLSYIYIYIYTYIYISNIQQPFFLLFHGTKQLACLLPQHISPKVLWSKLMPQKVDAELNLQGIRDLRSQTSHGGNGSPCHTLKGTLDNMANRLEDPPVFNRKYIHL